MSACHVTPFQLPGVLIAGVKDEAPEAANASAECCDYCACPALEWRKCKLICTNCRQINKSCADL